MKKPCRGCPFRKDNNLVGDKPGGSEPSVYIGQAMGPFFLPCHEDKNYNGKETDYKSVSHCRGAASFRTHIGVAERMPEQLSQEANKEDVFEDRESFLAHYLKIDKELIEAVVSESIYSDMLQKELLNADVKHVKL